MNKTSFINFDILLLLATVLLVIIGILFIYSSGVSTSGLLTSNEFTKQIIWAITGIFLMILFLFLSYTHLKTFALPIYFGSLLVLIFTLIFGKVVNNSRSWIDFGIVGFQPSEFTKITTILFLAVYFEKIGNKIRQLPYYLLGFIIIFLPVILILLQPDLGTAIVFFPIYIIASFCRASQTFLFIILPVH
jgi:rod shape determining protein RodA